MNIRLPRTVKTLIKITISLGLLVLLFKAYDLDPKAIEDAIASINIYWFLLSCLSAILVLGMKSMRWKLLLREKGVCFPLKRAFQSYMAAYALGTITPGRLGELVKVYNVRKHADASFYSAFMTTMSDRIFDLLILVACAIAFIVNNSLYHGHASIILASTLAISIILYYLIAIVTIKLFRLLNLNRYKLLNVVHDLMADTIGKKSMIPLILTIISYLLYFVGTWMVFRSLDVSIGVSDTGMIISIVGLVLLLPISFAGFGSREITLVFVLSFYNVLPEIAILFSLIHFVAFFVWGSLVGFLFWVTDPIPLSLLVQDYKKVIATLNRNRVSHD